MTSEERQIENQPPEPGDGASRFLGEALRYLTGEGRRRDPTRLLEGLHERFRAEGTQKLSDLVYEMIRSCLASFPDYAQRSFEEVRPRSPEIISGELRTMNEGLIGVSAKQDLGSVARTTPSADVALDDTHKCIVVLAKLEGRTARQQLALALWHIHRGAPSEAEPVLRELMDAPDHSEAMRWYARANLAFCLHRQDRSAEAIPVALAALDERPDIPTPCFNLISCAAEVGDRALFEQSLERLGAMQRREPSPVIVSFLEAEAGLLATQMQMSREAILQLAGMSSRPSSDEGEGRDMDTTP